MFEINRSKFNVESSYDEEMTEYTYDLNTYMIYTCVTLIHTHSSGFR